MFTQILRSILGVYRASMRPLQSDYRTLWAFEGHLWYFTVLYGILWYFKILNSVCLEYDKFCKMVF